MYPVVRYVNFALGWLSWLGRLVGGGEAGGDVEPDGSGGGVVGAGGAVRCERGGGRQVEQYTRPDNGGVVGLVATSPPEADRLPGDSHGLGGGVVAAVSGAQGVEQGGLHGGLLLPPVVDPLPSGTSCQSIIDTPLSAVSIPSCYGFPGLSRGVS